MLAQVEAEIMGLVAVVKNIKGDICRATDRRRNEIKKAGKPMVLERDKIIKKGNQ